MKESHYKDGRNKGLKVGNLNQAGEDRISQLPDSILGHILSFLPTKYAVATSVLSSRWKLVWTSLSDLCFDDRLCSKGNHRLTNDDLTRFENFVNRVLLFNLSNINKLSLHCSKLRYLGCLQSWLSIAIMRNVREIELDLDLMDSDSECVELPECIYTCKTLEVLKLESYFTIKNPPSGICFPSVKILQAALVYSDSSWTERLFTICPVLEDLSITVSFARADHLTKLNISSNTLKRLTLDFEKEWHPYDENQVMIRAPNLELLCIQDQTSTSYTMLELHSLNDVLISIFNQEIVEEIHTNLTLQLLEGITKAKYLSLSSGTMRAIGNPVENIFPTFPNLTCLDMELGAFGWRVLPIILNRSPNLEVLVLSWEFYDSIIEGYEWVEPQFVPTCLLFNVKKIEMSCFEGHTDELKLVRFLLKNGEVLEKMIVKSLETDLKKKFALCQKLLMYERGSKTCQIQFL